MKCFLITFTDKNQMRFKKAKPSDPVMVDSKNNPIVSIGGKYYCLEEWSFSDGMAVPRKKYDFTEKFSLNKMRIETLLQIV